MKKNIIFVSILIILASNFVFAAPFAISDFDKNAINKYCKNNNITLIGQCQCANESFGSDCRGSDYYKRFDDCDKENTFKAKQECRDRVNKEVEQCTQAALPDACKPDEPISDDEPPVIIPPIEPAPEPEPIPPAPPQPTPPPPVKERNCAQEASDVFDECMKKLNDKYGDIVAQCQRVRADLVKQYYDCNRFPTPGGKLACKNALCPQGPPSCFDAKANICFIDLRNNRERDYIECKNKRYDKLSSCFDEERKARENNTASTDQPRGFFSNLFRRPTPPC
ncbi:MAG: hypothetical protein AAB847_00530 [Patescibacteria group bacterium]